MALCRHLIYEHDFYLWGSHGLVKQQYWCLHISLKSAAKDLLKNVSPLGQKRLLTIENVTGHWRPTSWMHVFVTRPPRYLGTWQYYYKKPMSNCFHQGMPVLPFHLSQNKEVLALWQRACLNHGNCGNSRQSYRQLHGCLRRIFYITICKIQYVKCQFLGFSTIIAIFPY